MQAASLKDGKKTILIGNRCLTIKTKKEMKKNLFMVAAVALMALVSCNKEEINNNEIINDEQIETPSDIVFVAEFDNGSETKTALGEVVDGVRQATWVKGDAISINGTTFTAVADGARTEFTTTSSFDENAKVFRAVYPSTSYKASAVVIPVSQNGTFENASIAVAESNDQSLKFSNVSSILKFQVPAACTTVTFESTSSIAGQISINYTDGVMVPNYTSLTNPQKKITVAAVGGFVTGKDYYVAVKPGDHQFTVSIDGNVSKASTKSVTVERSKILNMKVLPEPVVAENAVLRINNKNGWGDLKITIKQGSTTIVNAQAMTNEGNNIFAYTLDPKYVGYEVTYYLEHSWYMTSTKTVTLAADSEAEAIVLNTTYLQPNDWNSDSPRYGAHIWVTDKSGIWVNATKVKDNFYEVEVPTNGNYTNIIWCRMDPSNSTNGWGAVWNQTGDLTLQHKCYCIQSKDAWNKPTGNYWY